MAEPDDQRWKKVMDIDITAVIEGAVVAYNHILAHEPASGAAAGAKKFIISTASMAGLLPQAGPVYAAAKGAVVHFMRPL